MAYDISNKIISETNVDLPDVKQAIGSSSNSVVALCTDSARINPMAMHKPIRTTAKAYATVSAYKTAAAQLNYGLTIPVHTYTSTDNPTALVTVSNGAITKAENWTWNLPNASSGKRIGDFRDYYSEAQNPVVCCTYPDETILVDSIRDDGNFDVPFYIFQKSGLLADGTPHTTQGIDRSGNGRNSAQLAKCLAFDELNGEGYLNITGKGSLYSMSSTYFGLAVFNNDGTYVRSIVCSRQLEVPTSTYYTEMYRLNSDTIKNTNLTGTYKAVPVIRQYIMPFSGQVAEYTYIPLPTYPLTGNSPVFRNLFTLKIGGAEFYPYAVLGINTTGSTTIYDATASSSDTVYIIVQVTNNSGKALTIDTTASNYWKVAVKVTGRAYTNATTYTEINRTNYMTCMSGQFTIAAGATTKLVFTAGVLWSNGSTPPSTLHTNSYVNFTFGNGDTHSYLYHYRGSGDSQRFTASGATALTVHYPA